MYVIITKSNTWFNKGEVCEVQRDEDSFKTIRASKKQGMNYYIEAENCKIITKDKNPEYFL